MSDIDTFYAKAFNWLSYKVEMNWVKTEFPNLLLLCLGRRWLEESDVYPSEFESLIENGNTPPKWLKRITKNKVLESPEISFQLFDNSSLEWNYDFETYSSSGDDDFFKVEDIAYILEPNREVEEVEHECDSVKYVYFELMTPTGFYLATTDGIEYEDVEEFWEAIRKSEQIVFGNLEESPAFENFWGYAISSCSQCVPDCQDQFEADAAMAIQEIIEATSLSPEQKETIDSLLMPVLSNPDENGIDEDSLSQLKESIAELTQKYPGDFPQLEYWLATN